MDVLLRQLQSTGQAHYTVCEQMENVSTDMKDMQSNLNQIQNSTGIKKSQKKWSELMLNPPFFL